MQTSTAHDVALTPPQCPTTEAPGPYFQKEFFHNGYIKSLKQLVHFYNTRDVYRMPVESGDCPPGTVERVTCWPAAEVPQNQDMTIGKLDLTDAEENQIVAFLKTLNDGFTRPYPDINTYTGVCMLQHKAIPRSFRHHIFRRHKHTVLTDGLHFLAGGRQQRPPARSVRSRGSL
jgi:cytochrome c peroxidase